MAAIEFPEVTWSAIVELSRRPLTDQQIASLAAGWLEDLLCHHGPDFIDRVEKEARVYRALAQALMSLLPAELIYPSFTALLFGAALGATIGRGPKVVAA